MTDLEERLRTHLARVVATPVEAGLENRIMRRLPGTAASRRPMWLAQGLAAAALVAIVSGAFFGLRAVRPNVSVESPPVTTQSPPAVFELPRFGNLRMVTPEVGWASTTYGVLRTTDRWAHWANVGPRDSSASSFSAQFVNSTTAWLAASESRGSLTIFHTSDGGTTWRRSSLFDPGSGFTSTGHIQFVDATHGWLWVYHGAYMGRKAGALFRTTDGGVQWTKVEETLDGPEIPGSLPLWGGKAGVSFINPRTGWAAGSCFMCVPFFFVTHDGGQTWAPQQLPIAANFSRDATILTSLPLFLDSRTGYFTMSGELEPNRSAMFVYTTADAGATWVPHKLPVNGAEVTFTSPAEGWLISRGADAAVYRTDDGGQNWRLLALAPQLAQLQVFDAADARHGTAAADLSMTKTELLATTDGGATWKPIQSSCLDRCEPAHPLPDLRQDRLHSR